ncbi:MAG: hypothetical protein WAZ12_02710 [Candidatus Absconditicoccaceae bacterium]
MALEESIKKEIKDISGNVDCKREQGEKQKIIDLGKKTEGLNISEKRDDLVECKNLLGSQKLGNSEQTLEDFLKKDIKSILVQKKAEWDAKSNSSNTSESVQDFINGIGQEIQSIFGNKNDKVAILQVYLNSVGDVNSKHAIIPYNANKYNYKAGQENRLFIDGILGPHTYNALWLATFGEELPKIELVRKSGYAFDRNEPRIIGKDQAYIPLTLPGLDKNGNIESSKTIEIIDNPKIKGAIELLYLFYDGVSKKDNLGIDIDTEIMKIMTDPKLYDNENRGANSLDGYVQAIKQLNIKIAGDKSDLKKGRDAITKYLNNSGTIESSELAILNTLEYDVGVHEYVANYIASKYINLSKEPYKSKMESIKSITTDKDFNEYEKDIDKKWIEQKAVQKKFILETFNNAKVKATTPELQQELCQMFEVDDVSKVTSGLIGQKSEAAIKLAEEDFKTSMFDNYFNKRFFEENIRKDIVNLNSTTAQYEGKNQFTALFADIQGIGYMNPSSENMDTAKFIGQMIAEEAACFAIGALTAGAGGVLLKAALYGRRAMKIARLAKAVSRGAKIERRISKFNQVRNLVRTVNIAEKTVKAERALTWGGKAINATTTILGVTVGGAAFYEGTNAMQNIIKDVPMFQGWNDYPEVLKSIAMFGALKIVNKLVATQKLITVAGKQLNANPFNKLLQIKNGDKLFTKGMKIAGESLVGGGAIFAVEGVGEMIIDTEHDRTKEEFIQAVLMYMIFRGAGEVGKLKLSKNKKTLKPEIQKENPKQLTAAKEQKQITAAKEQKQLTEGKTDLNTERAKLEADYKRLYQEHINAKTKPEQTRLQDEITKNRTRANEIDSKLAEQTAKNSSEIENTKQSTENNVKKEAEPTKPETKTENKTSTTAEIKKMNDNISSLQSEIVGQKNELNNAKLALKNISDKGGKPDLERKLKDNVFAREQDIKFKQAELDKLILERNKFMNQSLGVQEAPVTKKSEPQPKENTKEPVKKELTKEEIKAKENKDLIDKQNKVQELADDFDAQIMSDKGITINGKNYKLIYEPNTTQNASRKGEWKYIEDGKVVTSIKGNAGILPDNAAGNNIRANYNKLRNKYIESGTGKSLVETKIIPINRPSLLYWIKENPGIAATGALLVTIGGGTLIYKIATKSDASGQENIDISPVKEPEKIEQKDVINLIEGENGQYVKLD